jgi:SAM-dependent methyltransferase
MAVSKDTSTPATDMVDYYKRRASYYERVYHKPERQDDLRRIEDWVAQTFRGRSVLEIACGTGWWTPHGARHSRRWLATDLNPETLAIARLKPLPEGKVHFQIVDAYRLSELDGPPESGKSGRPPFDAGFAGCWWSHIPLVQLDGWIDTVHQRLAPGARMVVLDNSFVQTSSTPLTRRDADGNTYQNRTLDDGSVHEVLKNFPTADELQQRLADRAAQFEWFQWTHYWAASWTVRR